MEMWSKSNLASLLFALGQLDEALAVAEEVIEWDRAQGGSLIAPVTAIPVANTLTMRGRLEEAAELAADFLPRIQEAGDPQILIPGLHVAALVAIARGELETAARLARETRSIKSGNAAFRFYELAGLVRVLIRCGAREDAQKMVIGLEPRFVGERADVLSARAEIEEANEAFESGSTLYQEAAEVWSQLGNVIEQNHALLGEGRCLVQLGRTAEAGEPLRAAREAWASLGASALTAEADEWLARATALSS
jgi:tetratricopeptide (TPR) repeat protein